MIIRRVGDGFLRTEFKEFWGAWGHAGDLNGDGRDEIILFQPPIAHAADGKLHQESQASVSFSIRSGPTHSSIPCKTVS